LSTQAKREQLKGLLAQQAARETALPRLSEAQRRLLEVEGHAPSAGIHTFALAYTLHGPLDVPALEQALHAVAARHPGLRSRVATDNGAPAFAPVSLTGPLLERYEAIREGTEAALEARLRAEAALPLDPRRDRAWRCALFPLSVTEHVLLVRFHHILADRWSVGIFARDLSAAYSALLAGKPASLPALPPPPDADEEEDAAQRDYWRKLFSRPAPTLELLLARAQEGFSEYAGERIETELDPATMQALKEMAAAQSLTLFPILLAAFAALLRAYTGQEDLILCTPVTGRHRAGTRHQIGYFNNILPMRLDLRGDPDFLSLARRIAAQARAAYAHQDVPFHRIAALPELGGLRTTRCLFAVQNIPGINLALPGVESSYRDIPNGTANFDLSLFLEERNERFACLLDVKTAVFDAEAAGEIQRRFATFLQYAAERPTTRRSEFPACRQTPAPSVRPETTATASGEVLVDNLLEQRLIELWRGLFPDERACKIGPETDFFRIGGDSLKAARLFAGLQREFHVEWPLATLIEAPTPRKLAQRLADQEWVQPWMSLVPLRTAGVRPPLYFLPGGYGNILCFRRIADGLGDEQPVYCLQAKGLKRGERALRSVEETAATYIEVIRQAQPQGPYLLAGHSFGAVVAYEMARRLILSGEAVPLLALLDHCGPDIRLSSVDYVRTYLRSLAPLSAREKAHILWESAAWKLHVRRAVRHRKSATARKTDPDARWTPADVAEGALRALRDYKIPPYPGRITLFRAEQHPRIRHDLSGGWGSVAAEGVEVIDVPGTHETMLEEPHVQVLGAQLALCLDQIASHAGGAYTPL